MLADIDVRGDAIGPARAAGTRIGDDDGSGLMTAFPRIATCLVSRRERIDQAIGEMARLTLDASKLRATASITCAPTSRFPCVT